MSGAVHAQSFRAYLSVSGSDGNPCTVAAPCRLLPAALNAIAPGGEVWMLDSANYNSGTVAITKSATILAIPGVVGSFVAFGGGPALTISGAVTVTLRNVVIANNVTNPGTDGIQITGGTLEVFGSQISAPTDGIRATGAIVRVHDSFFPVQNTGIESFGGSAVDVWRTRFSGGTVGVYGHAETASAAASMTISDSSFANMVFPVIANAENATGTMKAVVTRSTFAGASRAISVQNLGGTAKGTVSASTFSNNSSAAVFFFGGAVIESTGNNMGGSSNAAINSNGTFTGIGTF